MKRFAIASVLLALLAGQQLAVVALTAQPDNDDGANRKLLATQKADILPLIIKGVVFLAAAKAKIAAAGAKVGAVLGSKAVGNVLMATNIGLSVSKATSSATVCGASCAGTASASGTTVNGCNSESCLCSALGPGVHPNIFDNTCGSFFHCPGPKRPCGPGTLFNPETRVCDWPANVNCVAVRA